MARYILPVVATAGSSNAAFVAQLNAALASLLAIKILAVDIVVTDTLPSFARTYQAMIDYQDGGSPMSAPFTVTVLEAASQDELAGVCNSFMATNSTQFIAPVQYEYTDQIPNVQNRCLAFYIASADAVNGELNYQAGGGGGGGGPITGSVGAGRVAFGSAANVLSSSSQMTFLPASGFSMKRAASGASCESFGFQAGNTTMTGADNTAVGAQSGKAITGGTGNTSVGTRSLLLCSGGSYNTALGLDSMGSATSATANTCVGSAAGYGITGGAENVAVGASCLSGGAAGGSKNVAVGFKAMWNTGAGSDNVAVGVSTLQAVGNTASFNVAVGSNALFAVTSGDENVAVGYRCGQSITTGMGIVAIGSQAAIRATTGVTAVGFKALNAALGGPNTAIGYQALRLLTTGINNTALGTNSNGVNLTGSYNVSMGTSSLGASTGSCDVGIGYQAGLNISGAPTQTAGTFTTNRTYIIVSTGTTNFTLIGAANSLPGTVFVATGPGSGTGTAILSSSGLVAVGFRAALSMTSGFGIAIGPNALAAVTTGDGIAIGRDALRASTGSGNTAIGSSALQALTTGLQNIGIGSGCFGALLTGSQNCVVGEGAGAVATVANGNVCIGHRSGDDITSMTGNVFIGVAAGNNQGGGTLALITNTLVLGGSVAGVDGRLNTITVNYNAAVAPDGPLMTNPISFAASITQVATEFHYWGGTSVDGSWRWGRSGTNLVAQRREAGVWVTKQTIVP